MKDLLKKHWPKLVAFAAGYASSQYGPGAGDLVKMLLGG